MKENILNVQIVATEPDDFAALAVLVALQDLFNHKPYFDICVVDVCLEAAGIQSRPARMIRLRPLHCIHYGRMPKGMKELLIAETLALFEEGGVRLELREVDPAQSSRTGATPSEPTAEAPKRGILQRLLSHGQ